MPTIVEIWMDVVVLKDKNMHPSLDFMQVSIVNVYTRMGDTHSFIYYSSIHPRKSLPTFSEPIKPCLMTCCVRIDWKGGVSSYSIDDSFAF